MSRFTRKLVAAATVGALLTGTAALSAPAQAAAKTNITFFTFSAAPDHLDTLNQMITAFEKANPDVHVIVQTASYNDYWTKLKTRLAGSAAPDTFELNYENFVSYAKSGSLLNLNSVIKADSSFNKSVFAGKAYDVFNLAKKQYGLPESYSTVVLMYNKDLFDAAKVSYPKSNWTWADEMLAATKIQKTLPEGSFADFQPIQFWEFYKVLGQAGGKFLNSAGTKVAFNDLKGLNALNWLLSKQEKGLKPTAAQMGGLDDGSMFKAGKLAMIHTGIWMFDSFKDAPFKWDIAVQPGGVTKGNHFFANAVVASAKTKKAAAAWKWMRFFTSARASVKARVAASWEVPAVSDSKAVAGYLAKTPPANRQAVFDALKNPVTPPVIVAQSQMQDAMNAWLEKAANGTVTAVEALDGAAEEINAILAKE